MLIPSCAARAPQICTGMPFPSMRCGPNGKRHVSELSAMASMVPARTAEGTLESSDSPCASDPYTTRVPSAVGGGLGPGQLPAAPVR
eukprot:16339367-Heterocapsa_arctica.AAC.1